MRGLTVAVASKVPEAGEDGLNRDVPADDDDLDALEREKVCNFLYLPAYGGLMNKGLLSQVVEKARALFDVFDRLLGHASFS